MASEKRDALLEPWQFFLLGGMLAATATVIVATGQAPANIIILSLTVVAVSFVGLGAYRILLPLVSTEAVDSPPLIGGRTLVALEREKQLVLRSIKELEFDFAMGKMSQADFDEMSHRLRARAFRLMRQLDAGGGYRHQIEKALEEQLVPHDRSTQAFDTDVRHDRSDDRSDNRSKICACGVSNDYDARFCKSCGSKL